MHGDAWGCGREGLFRSCSIFWDRRASGPRPHKQVFAAQIW